MNMIACSENCRWQNDGFCTLEDLSHSTASFLSQCRYFENN